MGPPPVDDRNQSKLVLFLSSLPQILGVKFLCPKCEEVRKSRIHFNTYVSYIKCPECKYRWSIQVKVEDSPNMKRDSARFQRRIILKNVTAQRNSLLGYRKNFGPVSKFSIKRYNRIIE